MSSINSVGVFSLQNQLNKLVETPTKPGAPGGAGTPAPGATPPNNTSVQPANDPDKDGDTDGNGLDVLG
jgi:hypothetical protein